MFSITELFCLGDKLLHLKKSLSPKQNNSVIENLELCSSYAVCKQNENLTEINKQEIRERSTYQFLENMRV